MNRYPYTDSSLEDAVRRSISVAETLRALGVPTNSGNYQTFWRKVTCLGLSTKHFLGQAHLKGRSRSVVAMPLSKILVKRSTYTKTNDLKKRLIRDKRLRRECSNKPCPTRSLDSWMGSPVPLCLDHVNGNRRDNRIENLRLLCPNCHALTPTFSGRNNRKAKTKRCLDCCTSISKTSERCRWCANKNSARSKIEWPSIKALKREIKKTSMNAVARRLGVTFNAVKKHLKKHSVVCA